ncbi:MAG: hypothetical protein MUO76_22995 [Anaerolineaceae bacterium]|nr:hypothetical protein [Anaerolineaceae bacterium]
MTTSVHWWFFFFFRFLRTPEALCPAFLHFGGLIGIVQFQDIPHQLMPIDRRFIFGLEEADRLAQIDMQVFVVGGEQGGVSIHAPTWGATCHSN